MLREFNVISIALLCSVCISHPAQYYTLTIMLENNIPRFDAL